MARAAVKRSSFRDKVAVNSQQQRSKSASYGHLVLPRGINVFKEEPGSRVSLDILPYMVTDSNHPDRDEETGTAVNGELWYRRPYKLHRNIGAENTSVICPSSVGKKCPICEYRAKLLAEGAKWDDEDVKVLRPSDRNVYYVEPKGVKKFEEKPHIWDIAQFLFQAKLNDELEENDEFCEFPDLEDGLTLKIRFSVEKFGKNEFADTARIDFEKREYQYKMADIEKLPSLDDVLDIKTYKEVEHLFLDQDEADDEPDDAPSRREPSRLSKKDEEEDAAADIASAQRRELADDDDPHSRSVHRRREPTPADDDAPPARTRRREPEPDPEPDEKPARSTRRTPEPEPEPVSEKPQRRARTAPADEATEKCPANHRFGKDVDKYDECEECKLWNACMDASETA